MIKDEKSADVINLPLQRAEEESEERSGLWWDEVADLNPEAIIFDGPVEKTLFDKCIVGYASRPGLEPVLVYDEDKMIEVLFDAGGMNHEEVNEYLSFNTWGAWLGEGTPMILTRRFEDTDSFG
jgi:hypothetical protein